MMAETTLYAELITPTGKVFEGHVRGVQVPGSEELGGFAVLANHAPLVSNLQAGKVTLLGTVNGDQAFTITGGVVEVKNNRVVVLAEGARAWD